jgi:DNA gyrase/topoisomerase IV subunit B
LPLRGKVLNAEQASLAKVLENEELGNIVKVLGCGIGKDFNAEQLRYGKVILLMDADSDGYHISTLLLTFFFRHMRELIQSGKVFLAQPPLYKIEIGKERYYAQDDAAKESFLAAQPTNRTPDVQRFKGLGEMNAEQLKETTLDPRTRSLLRVDIDNFVNADATFAQLLGKDPAERYRVIMEEAADVDDLDV